MEPKIGFRIIEWQDPNWISPFQRQYIWRKGLMQAGLHKRHLPPRRECPCGLYACWSLFDVIDLRENQAVATIAGSGKILAYDQGWRGSEAQIISILNWPTSTCGEEAAAYFDVPFLAVPNVVSHAQEHGQVKNPLALSPDGLFPFAKVRENLHSRCEELIDKLEDNLLHNRTGATAELQGFAGECGQPLSYVSESEVYRSALLLQGILESTGLGYEPEEIRPTPSDRHLGRLVDQLSLDQWTSFVQKVFQIPLDEAIQIRANHKLSRLGHQSPE